MKDNTEITTVASLNKQPCLRSEDRLPLYCAHNGVVAMATGDMTGIPAQVVHLTSAPTVNIFES